VVRDRSQLDGTEPTLSDGSADGPVIVFYSGIRHPNFPGLDEFDEFDRRRRGDRGECSMSERPVIHDEECDAALYEGATCACNDDDESGRRAFYDVPVYGEEPSSHDGRPAGPAMDW
jgi:hypothetical protein